MPKLADVAFMVLAVIVIIGSLIEEREMRKNQTRLATAKR